MAKDPAFLFYHNDFLVGTTFMTFEEKGAYITLLCHLADKGSLPEEQILKVVPQTIWHAIRCKFKKGADGYYNERLLQEVSKRKGFCASRRENIKKRYICSTSEPTSVEHMEIEDVNRNEDEDDKEDKGCGEKGKKVQTIEERIANCRAVFGDKAFIEKASKAYPSVNFEKEQAKMESWIVANPKMSNKTNWKRFVNNWLCSEQEKVEKNGEKSGRCIEHSQGDRAEKYRKITKVVEV